MATEAQWIDVNDALPVPERRVLIAHERVYLGCGSYHPTCTCERKWHGEIKRPVTHWMPLPAPPTAARKGE